MKKLLNKHNIIDSLKNCGFYSGKKKNRKNKKHGLSVPSAVLLLIVLVSGRKPHFKIYNGTNLILLIVFENLETYNWKFIKYPNFHFLHRHFQKYSSLFYLNYPGVHLEYCVPVDYWIKTYWNQMTMMVAQKFHENIFFELLLKMINNSLILIIRH